MRRSHVFEAHDGHKFATAEECREHEDRAFVKFLSHLNEEAVEDALARRNIGIADAFERAGNIISAKRRGSGELRKAKKLGAAMDGALAIEREDALADKTGVKDGKLLADKLEKRRQAAAE